MYRFRIYLKEIMDIEELCLDALVKENGDYEILLSWGSVYENLLKEGLEHALSIVYIEQETNEKKIETIQEAENIKQTLDITAGFVHRWYNLMARVDKLRED